MSFNVPLLIRTVPPSAPYAAWLAEACRKYDINTWLRQMHFLAQMAHESQGFMRVRENLNYSESALISMFGRHRISLSDAKKYGRNSAHPANQQALANILYGGHFGRTRLGNTLPGDGWKFRGRGLKQITGRYNYEQISYRLFDSDILLHDPHLLEIPRWAAMSAGAFWDMKNLNELADDDDLLAITKVVNGGTNGLEGTGGRRWWLQLLKLEM